MLSEKELKILSEFETQIGLANGFYYSLLKDDDWSFVIKIHSLIEAAITYSLSESIKISFRIFVPEQKIDLYKFFSFLDTSNNNSGKVAFLKGLDIPNEKYRGFIRHLSEMRNKMIHSVTNVGMSIKGYYESLDTEKKNDFKDKTTISFISNIEVEDKSFNKNELFETNPKIVIWYTAFQCISELYYFVKLFELKKDINTREKEIKEREKQIFEKLYPLISKLIKG